MLTLFYKDAAYVVLDYSPDIQGYRTNRFEGWLQQPAKIGPVIFSNSSPTYFNLKPVGSSSSGGGSSSTTLVIVIVVLAVLILGGGGFAYSRSRSAGERD